MAYTISAPASALPSFGQFFVEAASFCDDAAAGGGGGGKEAVSAVVVGDGGKRRRRRERRALRRAKESKKGEKQPPAAPAAAEAVQSWAAVDDLFVQNTVDGRWSVQSQTRLNNTDAAKGRCNVQFTVCAFWGCRRHGLCGKGFFKEVNESGRLRRTKKCDWLTRKTASTQRKTA